MSAVLQSDPQRVAPAALHPARLGKYELLGVVGEGAMGTVYQALDPLLQRQVAIKAIHPHLLRNDADADGSIAERFRNEAKAAGRLSHPGIVPIYEYGEDGGCAFIAMEFVRGLTLSRYLAAVEPLPEDAVLSIAVQLLEALHHAHEQGVWHRDIKPGNLMLTADGCVKVTDFGIARLASTALLPASPHTELLVGSPGYIAPERYAGAAPDRRVDIFSCGVLLYQLLSGVTPFAGSASEVMFQVMHCDPPPPSQVGEGRAQANAAFDAVVFKALARRPSDRYATALELRDALLAVAMRPVSRRLKLVASRQAWVGDGGTDPGAPGEETPAASPTPSQPRRALLAEVPRSRPSGPALESLRPIDSDGALGLDDRDLTRPTDPGPSIEPMLRRPGPETLNGWPMDMLKAFEDALIEPLGPIARVLVPRTAARCRDLPTLMQGLAAAGLSAREQQTFFAAVRRVVAASEAQADAARVAACEPAASAMSVPTAPPKPRIAEPPLLDDPATLIVLRPATVARAQALLAAHLGPIAALLVERALARRSDRDGFFLALADEAQGCVDRKGLIKALQRLP